MNKNRIDIMLDAQIKYTIKLWQEKEELQQRIDKAIEWLFKNGYEENEYISSLDGKLWIKSNPEELYNILVGYEEDE